MRTLSRSFAGTAAATTTRGNEKTHQPFLLLLFCLCNFVFGCSSLSILELHIPTGGKDDESRTAGEPLRDSRLTYSRRALVSVFPFFLLLLLLFVFLKKKKRNNFFGSFIFSFLSLRRAELEEVFPKKYLELLLLLTPVRNERQCIKYSTCSDFGTRPRQLAL